VAVTEKIIAVPEVKIPQTSKDRYISGLYALNVRAPEGTTGDWHDVWHWRGGIDSPRSVMLAGVDTEADTIPIYGDFGIYEGKNCLADSGLDVDSDISEVYIANHYRAILDMLYRSLKKYGEVYNLSGATNDWLDTDEQKALVLSRAKLLENLFDGKASVALQNWIAAESGSDWRE
jgi:hypothetical protein